MTIFTVTFIKPPSPLCFLNFFAKKLNISISVVYDITFFFSCHVGLHSSGEDLDVSDKPAVNRIIPVNTLTHCEDITGERQKSFRV